MKRVFCSNIRNTSVELIGPDFAVFARSFRRYTTHLITQVSNVQDVYFRDFSSHGDLARLLHFLFYFFRENSGKVRWRAVYSVAWQRKMFIKITFLRRQKPKCKMRSRQLLTHHQNKQICWVYSHRVASIRPALRDGFSSAHPDRKNWFKLKGNTLLTSRHDLAIWRRFNTVQQMNWYTHPLTLLSLRTQCYPWWFCRVRESATHTILDISLRSCSILYLDRPAVLKIIRKRQDICILRNYSFV